MKIIDSWIVFYEHGLRQLVLTENRGYLIETREEGYHSISHNYAQELINMQKL